MWMKHCSKWLQNEPPCIAYLEAYQVIIVTHIHCCNLISSFFTFSVSRSKRAGLVFSVSRTENILRRGRYSKLIGKSSSIYLAAVLEYLTAELLELAGNFARDNGRHRIAPRFINMAVQSDDELQTLLKDVTISEGGVMPKIHRSLLPKKTEQRTSKPSKSSNGQMTAYIETV